MRQFGTRSENLITTSHPGSRPDVPGGNEVYHGLPSNRRADSARNTIPWGILLGGEELHNNHHAHPGRAKFSRRWWEIDIGWVYIRTLEWLGLAQRRSGALL